MSRPCGLCSESEIDNEAFGRRDGSDENRSCVFVLHDFGDLVRTAACSALEDEPGLEKVFFLPETFEAIVEGYLETAGNILEPIEIEHLAIAPQIITYELGLRFLTDYLEGDLYFKTKRPLHNLDRVRAQFRLLASMEEHFDQARQIVDVCTRPLLTL